MNLQGELDFLPRPNEQEGEEHKLVRWLKSQSSWKTAADCCLALGLSITSGNKRKVRDLASASREFIVSYPGSPGYRHIDKATSDELEHAAKAHRSQLEKHQDACQRYLRAFHARAPRAPRV